MLKKWFIPNYQNVESASVRNRYGTVASFFGIFTNILLGVMKLIIGVLSNSVTILADATNNLSDMIASIITLVGFRFSAKRPSKEHPYGYARYEYIANLFVSLFIFFIGLFFAKESFEKILHPSSLTIDLVTYLVLIVAVLVKGIQMMVYLDFGRRIDSDTLKATAMDSRNDMLSTLAILLSMIVMQVFHINIDGYTALLISFFVIYSAISLLQKALDPLIGERPSKELVERLQKKLKTYPEVLGIHDLVIHNYGVSFNFVSVHVELDAKMSFMESHQIADQIEDDFYREFGINIAVHTDPVEIDNPVVIELKEKVLDALKKYDANLEVHDFRIVEKKGAIQVLFDLVEPFEKDYAEDELISYLSKHVPKKGKDLQYSIKVDHMLT